MSYNVARCSNRPYDAVDHYLAKRREHKAGAAAIDGHGAGAMDEHGAGAIDEHGSAGGHGHEDSQRHAPAGHGGHDGGGHGGGGHGGHGGGGHGARDKWVMASAKDSDKDQPDTKFYDQYLKKMLEKKPPYPLLKGFLRRVIDLYPESTTWFDGGAGTCGTMEALLNAGRAWGLPHWLSGTLLHY